LQEFRIHGKAFIAKTISFLCTCYISPRSSAAPGHPGVLKALRVVDDWGFLEKLSS
jgi:hypothetical protein